jgi:hypothetical protein
MPTQPLDSAFSAPILIEDLHTIMQILPRFFSTLSTANPQQGTESGGKGWTLHETIAHVASVAEFYDLAIDETLHGKVFAFPGLEKRTDLRPVNDREIAARSEIPMESLVDTLQKTLTQTVRRAADLSTEQFALPVTICAYNRPLSVGEMIAAQLSHLGLVHAAQLANGMGVLPLWSHYPRDLMLRQISRFFNIMSHAYWPEHGGSLKAAVNFRVGTRGPAWHVIMAPDGGTSGAGAVPRSALTLWTPTLNALCNLMTLQAPLAQAILTGQVIAWGKVTLALKFGYLFEN